MKKIILYGIVFIVSAMILVLLVAMFIAPSRTLKTNDGRLKESNFLFTRYKIKEDGYIRFNLYGDNGNLPNITYYPAEGAEEDRDYISTVYDIFLPPNIKEEKFITVPVFKGDELHYLGGFNKFGKYEYVEKMPEIDEKSLYTRDKEEVLFEYKDDTAIIEPKKMELFLNDNITKVSFISNENMIPKVVTFNETSDGIEMITTIDYEDTKVIIENDTELVFGENYKTYVYYQY